VKTHLQLIIIIIIIIIIAWTKAAIGIIVNRLSATTHYVSPIFGELGLKLGVQLQLKGHAVA
jgi:hypothetical protein